MKVLFVFLDVRTLMPSVYPFGIGSLSAVLKRQGHQVSVFVAHSLRDVKEFSKVLKEYNPGVVGFSGINSQFLYIAKMALLVKKWKNIPVICGGVHATLAPQDFIELDGVDGVVVGEGEDAFLEYIKALEQEDDYFGIKNFWFKRGKEIIKNKCRRFIQNLDSLPYFDRTIVDYQRIINETNNTLFMLAGRGCISDCRFCSVPSLGKKGEGEYARLRSVDNILGEIQVLTERYKFKYIYFRDDTFTWEKNWVLEFCNKYPKSFKYPFEILTRADSLDEEMIVALKQANCHCVWIGVDSGNKYIRNDVLNKKVTNKKILETCSKLQVSGIKTLMTNMIGLPFETKEAFNDTIELNKKIYSFTPCISQINGLGPKIFVFSPFRGTPLYDTCNEQKWVRPMRYGFRVYQESIIEMPQFPSKEVYALKRKFRYLVYKDSHPFIAQLYKIYDSRLIDVIGKIIPRKLVAIASKIFSKITFS